MGQPILPFRRSTMAFADPQGVALLKEVTKLNTLAPDVWLIHCQRIIGEG